MSVEECTVITLDVFTERRFGGNPLAIVPDATGLDDATMQRIAAELNLSETVFLHYLPDDHVPRLRIFTPRSELPFAGHPTVGTAIYLAEEAGLSEGAGLVMRTLAGDVIATINRTPEGSLSAEITAPRAPECRDAPSADVCAAAISLSASDIPFEPKVCDAGNPFTVIPVATRNALSRANLDMTAWAKGPGATDAAKMYMVYMDDWKAGRTVHTRMFAPSIGIAEDPATGSAVVALPALLRDIQGLNDGEYSWMVHQGDDMGRPSVMALRAVVQNTAVTSAHVAGTAVRVMSGRMSLQ